MVDHIKSLLLDQKVISSFHTACVSYRHWLVAIFAPERTIETGQFSSQNGHSDVRFNRFQTQLRRAQQPNDCQYYICESVHFEHNKFESKNKF